MSHQAKNFGVGFVGGVVGAGIVAAALGGLGYYKWKHMGTFLPTVLEFTTDQKSKFYAYAFLVRKWGSKKAKIVVPSFALTTPTPIKSAASGIILGGQIPVSLMPLSDSDIKVVHLHSKDTAHTITGKANISKNGVVVIVADQASGIGEAWGLAEELVLEYPVA